MLAKIGLFGGTFDPIHFGHLNLAFELMEKRNLDQVWFIPAQVNPFKQEAPPVVIQERINMAQLAIRDIPQFHVKDLEKDLPVPSYTIHTLKAFIEAEALNAEPHQFHLMLGEDALAGFCHWHLPEEIVKLVPLLIGSRHNSGKHKIKNFNGIIRDAIQKGMTTTRLMDISGTEIRQRLAQKLYCQHLVPAPVLEYIHKNQLYSLKPPIS